MVALVILILVPHPEMLLRNVALANEDNAFLLEAINISHNNVAEHFNPPLFFVSILQLGEGEGNP